MVELPAVRSELRPELGILLETRERLLELVVVVEVESRVRSAALSAKDLALPVREHRLSHAPGLERHHRKTLELGRHHEKLRSRERSPLVLVGQESQVAH